MNLFRLSAQDVVERWCRLYVRGLPARVSAERREELIGDVLDQETWARGRGDSEAAIRRAVIWRAAKGAPADLAWRRGQLSKLDRAGRASRIFGDGLMFAATLVALAFVTVAFVALLRNAGGSFAGVGSMTTFVAASAAICGVILLARSRTRSLGGLWLAISTPVLATSGVALLAANTTVLSYVSRSVSQWNLGQTIASVGLGAFYLAGAIWWTPGGKASS